MDDLNDYSWCAFYPAAARALCSYQNKRAALLKELYEALPAETGYLHDPERKPLKDIDPFSVFGILNRHISQKKKTETAEAFKRIFGLKEPVSDSKTDRLRKTLTIFGSFLFPYLTTRAVSECSLTR